MRNGWPDLVPPATHIGSVGDAQRAASPGWEHGGTSRRDPDADIVARPLLDYSKGASGELQPKDDFSWLVRR